MSEKIESILKVAGATVSVEKGPLSFDQEKWSLFFERIDLKGQYSRFMWTSQQIKDSVQNAYWWVEIEGQIAALAIVQTIEPVLEVLFLVTVAPFERRGLMKGLLGEILKTVPLDGQIWLEVHEKNTAATHLYEKLGMQRVGKRPRYYRDGGTALLYSLSNSLPHS